MKAKLTIVKFSDHPFQVVKMPTFFYSILANNLSIMTPNTGLLSAYYSRVLYNFTN